MRTLALTVATLLVGRAGAKSLTMAMAQIKKNAGFDPKEPPQHKTDVKVGMYIEHLLDVSAAASALSHTTSSAHAEQHPPQPPHAEPSSMCALRTMSMYRTQVSIEEHTFDMDFYFTLEWQDQRNYRRDITRSNLSQPLPQPQVYAQKPNPNPNPNPQAQPSVESLTLIFSPLLHSRSTLFADPDLFEQEPDSCEEQRSARSSHPHPHPPKPTTPSTTISPLPPPLIPPLTPPTHPPAPAALSPALSPPPPLSRAI